MFRVLALLVGGLSLFFGTLSVPLMRFTPPPSTLFWLLTPTLILAGGWLVRRVAGWWSVVLLFVISVMAVHLLTARFWIATSPVSSGMHVGREGVDVFGGDGRIVPIPLQVPARYRIGPLRRPRALAVRDGFELSVFAAGLDRPRFLAVGPQGDLFVSLPRSGKVVVLPDRDRDGVADAAVLFASDLDRPHGLAFVGEDLIVAESGRLLRLRDADRDLRAEAVEVLSDDIPGGGGHWTRTVAASSDGALYVSVGSSCNVCLDDPRRAAVLRFPPAGGAGTVFATGLRNSVGLAFHPQTGELWGSDNGRDLLGDDLPPEEINRIVAGGDYGWPFCYGKRIPDPEYGTEERCQETIPPQVEMQAHSAPLGIAFGDRLDFPPRYRDMLYVAFHGSWNRSVPTGYKLVGIPFREGRPTGAPVDIVTGWLQGGAAWGRPVAPVVGADGALYISDDRAGAIYRLSAAAGRWNQERASNR